MGVVVVLAVLSGPVGVDSWALIVIGGSAIIIGGTSFAIGIPTNIIGKNRVERINTIKNSAFNDINIDLRPCVQYNLAAQNHQPGVALRIRF